MAGLHPSKAGRAPASFLTAMLGAGVVIATAVGPLVGRWPSVPHVASGTGGILGTYGRLLEPGGPRSLPPPPPTDHALDDPSVVADDNGRFAAVLQEQRSTFDELLELPGIAAAIRMHPPRCGPEGDLDLVGRVDRRQAKQRFGVATVHIGPRMVQPGGASGPREAPAGRPARSAGRCRPRRQGRRRAERPRVQGADAMVSTSAIAVRP